MAETYRISIVVDGQDKASGPLGRVGSALGSIGTIAGGILSANVIRGIATGILDLGKDALTSYADFERLGMSLQSLTARELIHSSAVTKTTMTSREATVSEKERAAWLTKQIDELSANIGKMESGSDAAQNATKRLQGFKNELGYLGINANGWITTAQTSTVETLGMSDAMTQATPKAQELQRWIQKLAIESPFKQSEVADAFRLSMAYGFTTDQSQRLTQAMIDYSSASGASGDVMGRVALALGQIKARGKLAGQEILQLTEAGIPVRDILAKSFGVTTAQLETMVSSGAVPADKAIEALTTSLEHDFGGAAKRQAGTFSGLISSLSDIKEVGLRELFEGTFKAAQPYVQGVVDTLSNPDTMARINAIGQRIGQTFSGAIDWIKGLGPTLSNVKSVGGDIFGMLLGGMQGKKPDFASTVGLFGDLTKLVPPELAATITNVFGGISTTLANFGAFWTQNGPQIQAIVTDIFTKLGQTLGPVVSDIIMTIVNTFSQLSAWFVANGPLIQQFLGILGNLLTRIAGIFAALWPVVQNLFSWLLSAAMQVGTLFMQVFVTTPQNFMTTLPGILNTLAGILTTIINGVWTTLQDLAAWILSVLFGTTFEDGKARVTSALNTISLLFTGLGNKGKEILGWIVTSFNNVRNAINNAFNALAKFIDSFKDTILPDWVKRLLGIDTGNSSTASTNGTVQPAGARAGGGPVLGGRTYLVGENGPELFQAPYSGRIIPNDQLSSVSGAQTVRQFNITVHNNGGGMNENDLAAAIQRWEWAYGL